jgi:N-acetylglucosaminyl-diphospho-decaprenol L-rhamnosyltransferase
LSVSVLIVSFNTCELTLEAIGSVPGLETIVVDNASRDESPEAVARHFPSVRLIRSETNLGFAGGVNLAAAAATGDMLLVLNSDARPEPGAVELLVELLVLHPQAALVAPALRYPDGRPQPSAFAFPGLIQVALDLFPIERLVDTPLNGRVYSAAPRQVDHPLGACMLIRRAAWLDVGPLDEGYFMYLEEIDWAQRAHRRGWQIWFEPRAAAVHHSGAATRQQRDAMLAQLWRARLRYYQRYHGPFYNRLVRSFIRLGTPGHGAFERIRQLTA